MSSTATFYCVPGTCWHGAAWGQAACRDAGGTPEGWLCHPPLPLQGHRVSAPAEGVTSCYGCQETWCGPLVRTTTVVWPWGCAHSGGRDDLLGVPSHPLKWSSPRSPFAGASSTTCSTTWAPGPGRLDEGRARGEELGTGHWLAADVWDGRQVSLTPSFPPQAMQLDSAFIHKE